MTATILLTTTPMDRLMGIRDRFIEGGEIGPFVIVVVVLVLILLLPPLLLERHLRRRRHRSLNNPKKLFLEVLRQLQLTVPQRELIRRIARDLQLPQPTVLVLSPQIYSQNANAWMSASRNANPPMRARLDALATALFGDQPQPESKPAGGVAPAAS